MVRDLRRALLDLIDVTVGEDFWDAVGDVDDEIRVDFNNMMDRIRFLLEQIRSGDWQVNQAEDRVKIRNILREVRTIKHRSIRRLGDFGGRSMLDWYKKLFEIDFHIDNAADLWVDGQMLPEWDADQVKLIIRKAELSKYWLVRLFPPYLRRHLAWYYRHLYYMDEHLDMAKEVLRTEQIAEALRALRKVRNHRHAIEWALGG